jgi:hypothetical protein
MNFKQQLFKISKLPISLKKVLQVTLLLAIWWQSETQKVSTFSGRDIFFRMRQTFTATGFSPISLDKINLRQSL